MNIIEIKPNLVSYLLHQTTAFLISALGVISVIFIFFTDGDRTVNDLDFLIYNYSVIALILGVSFLGIIGFLYLSWKKESVILSNNHYIFIKGNPFIQSETKVHLTKVVKIHCKISFFEKIFLQTGTIEIKAIGQDISEIQLRHIRNPQEVYKQVVQDLQRENVYSDTNETSIAQRSPQLLGVIWNAFIPLLTQTFYIVLIPLFIVNIFELEFLLGIYMIAIGMILFLTQTILKAIQHSRSSFHLYSHHIEYKEDYFSQIYSIIPLKNITDIEKTQSVIQRLLNVSSLKLNAQGLGNSIILDNLQDVDGFHVAIESSLGLKNKVSLEKKGPNVTDYRSQITQSKEITTIETPENVDLNSNIPLSNNNITEKPHVMRGIFSIVIGTIILIPLFYFDFLIDIWVSGFGLSFFWYVIRDYFIGESLFIAIIVFGVLIWQVIRLKWFQVYSITSQEIQQTTNFLTNYSVTFQKEQITGVRISRNLFDRVWNTVSIHLYSLGKKESLHLSYIPQDSHILSRILKDLHLSDKDKHSIDTFHSCKDIQFIDFLKANLPVIIGLIALEIIALFIGIYFYLPAVIIWVPIIITSSLLIWYGLGHFESKHTFLERFPNFFSLHQGWIFQHIYYVKYENLEEVTSIQYPWSSQGSLIFQVASGGMLSGSFSFAFIKNGRDLHTSFDRQLISNSEFKHSAECAQFETDITIHPNLKAAIFNSIPTYGSVLVLGIGLQIYLFVAEQGTILTLFIIGLFILLLIVSFILYVYFSNKVTMIHIQKDRVMVESGILIRTHMSIVDTRINQMKHSQSVIQKWKGVGTVHLITRSGSDLLGLTLAHIPEYMNVYNMINKRIELVEKV